MKLFFIIVLAWILIFPLSGQQAGDLDSAFNGDGKQITDFGSDYDEIKALALQDDGKIIAAGHFYADSIGYDFIVARYDTNGNLDFSFDFNGYVTTSFDSSTCDANSVTIQDDGKIVVAGDATWYSPVFSVFTSDFILARYNADGSLDTTFSDDGKVNADFFSGEDHAYSVAIQSDGKIVAGGVTTTGSTFYDLAFARYNIDGTLDTSFSNDGLLTIPIPGYWRAMIIQDDDKIVAADGVTIVRLNSDGILDSTFSGDGIVSTDFAINYYTWALAKQPDGKIIAGGYSAWLTTDFALARFKTDGTPDSTFTGDGRVDSVDFGLNNNEEIFSLAVQADGKIVAAGHTGDIWTGDFALARFNTDGSLDAGFGTGGLLTTSFGTADDKANAVVIQDDGKIIAAGYTHGNSNSNIDFALSRYVSESAPCNDSITGEPDDVTAPPGSVTSFAVNASSTASFQWQTDAGSGWQDVTNGTQYSGAADSILIVVTITPSNHNQGFRCIVTFGVSCADTSEVAILTVPPTGIANVQAENIYFVYPNSAYGSLNICFMLQYESMAKLEIFNLSGQRIAEVFEGNVKAGELQKHEFTPDKFTDGMFIYRLQTANGSYYGKAVMVK